MDTHSIPLSFVPTLLSSVHIHSFYLCTQRQTILPYCNTELVVQHISVYYSLISSTICPHFSVDFFFIKCKTIYFFIVNKSQKLKPDILLWIIHISTLLNKIINNASTIVLQVFFYLNTVARVKFISLGFSM